MYCVLLPITLCSTNLKGTQISLKNSNIVKHEVVVLFISKLYAYPKALSLFVLTKPFRNVKSLFDKITVYHITFFQQNIFNLLRAYLNISGSCLNTNFF